ncbi:MAG: glycosyltransferase family 4 protein [Halanaerobiales bacterium]
MYDIMSGRDEMVFGHVGKLSPNKGQRQVIEPAIKRAGVRYFSHYNNYKKKVSHKDMPMVHHNYDVFICASDEDGTPCPALEAAACGRPIISNRIGNMPELIENYENGILLDSKNIDDYVDAIK